MKTYQGHKNEKYSVGGAFGVYYNEDKTEERAFVVSGCETGDIYTWDVQSKEILQKIGGHDGVVLGVDTWKVGGLVVSSGLDKTIRIWERDDGTEEEKDKEQEKFANGDGINGIGVTRDEPVLNGVANDHAVNGDATAMDVDVVREFEDHVGNGV